MNVKTLSVERSKLSASAPIRDRVNTSPESGSAIEIVVTIVWFSATLIVDALLIEGASFTSPIVTVTSALEVLSP